MDPLLLAAQLTLGVLGVVGVAAATPGEWQAHLARVLIALVVTALVARVTPQRIVKLSPVFCVAVLGLLVAVLFFGVAPDGSVARRWLDLHFFVLQPSELMKVAVIGYLTAFFYNHPENWQIWRPMLIVGLAVGLIAAEPNISTALFILLLGLAVMVAAGTSLKRLLGVGVPALLIAAVLAVPYLNTQYSYIGERFTGFLDRRGAQELTQDAGYQAAQAEQHLKRGGFFGIGTGQPFYLPAHNTDMIAISIGRSLGLVGTTTLFALYLLIALRGVKIASSMGGPGAILAAGATTYICGQAALNLLVAGGLLPVTGVPLPFVSHGFNSLISVGMAMGLIQSAYRSTRAARARETPARSGADAEGALVRQAGA